MNFTINPLSGKYEIELEEKDINDAEQVYRMTQSKGWQVIKAYHEVARESIIEKMKGIAHKKNSDESCSKLMMILKGIDDWYLEVHKLCERYHDYIKQKKENENDGQTNEF